AGLLGELLGVRDALWACAAALSAAPLVLLCSPLRRMRTFEDDAPVVEAEARVEAGDEAGAEGVRSAQ
ncbi:hypothetical protein GTW69_38655, partial [Streptomyces sp. SID7760]|nr:hypothetical protein [Streptomyces sp. SID7760]